MNKKQINNILIWFSAIVLIILIMTPGLWVVLTAFRPQVEILWQNLLFGYLVI